MLLHTTGQASVFLSESVPGKSIHSCTSAAKLPVGSLQISRRGREAASPGDETHICRSALKPTDHQSSPFAELGVREIWDGIGRTRVRQHVNPLCIQYQKPTGPLDWNSMFNDPSRPLVVDVGCGPGRFLLLMHHRHARQLQLQQQEQPCSQRGPPNGSLHAQASNEYQAQASSEQQANGFHHAQVNGDHQAQPSNDQQAQTGGFHQAQANNGQQAQPSTGQHAPSSMAQQSVLNGGGHSLEGQVRQAVGLTSRGAALEPMNYLGLEIRHPLVDRANSWATRLGCGQEVRFVNTNATISLATMLSSYPGPVRLVCIQFPDPHFKRRNHKRRIFQPNLVRDVASVLEPGGCVFLQSDVEEVSVAMRNVFEHQGAAFFDVAPEHHQPEATFFSAPESESEQGSDKSNPGSEGASQAPIQGAHQHVAEMQSAQRGSEAAWGDDEQGSKEYSDGEDEEQQGGGIRHANSEGDWENMVSRWAEAGWLKDNPVGVPTEREFYVEQQQLPVYRMLLIRK
ncbi:putative methyltransferase-domain-containing protein [Dunaliella salina]|uniref:tRNA (guanine(46)-N(7))-methyltransferase n=1 Tax=Dunaliella salina TaxID=3046 RepID=A0ABQ7GP65_DUNSA|nr:putative methyltransferase-domain-containing protein [Dunaliella salina]|eukprot:KAF5836399.1 putative methyltransferase-domain-containing protein [Dunaliella salina]